MTHHGPSDPDKTCDRAARSIEKGQQVLVYVGLCYLSCLGSYAVAVACAECLGPSIGLFAGRGGMETLRLPSEIESNSIGVSRPHWESWSVI